MLSAGTLNNQPEPRCPFRAGLISRRVVLGYLLHGM